MRNFIMFAVDKIGYKSMSVKDNTIKDLLFVFQFLAYGLIYLFGSNRMFNGIYPDFNLNWFKDVAPLIIATMTFNIYWPIIEFFLGYA